MLSIQINLLFDQLRLRVSPVPREKSLPKPKLLLRVPLPKEFQRKVIGSLCVIKSEKKN